MTTVLRGTILRFVDSAIFHGSVVRLPRTRGCSCLCGWSPAASLQEQNLVRPLAFSFAKSSLHTSSARLARGSRLQPVPPEHYPGDEDINPDLQPDSLPVDEELYDIASSPKRAINRLPHPEQQEEEQAPEGYMPRIGEVPLKRQRIQDQAMKVPRPRVDPAHTSVVLFPGQGSQFVGMGKRLLNYPNVPEIFGWASEILRYDLLKLCLEGPLDELTRTVHCQPAIFVTEIAALEKLKEDYPQAVESCVATAGFSVGEYASLVFGGALDFQDALMIVKARAEAMHSASQAVSGGMMTVQVNHKSMLTKGLEIARKWCQEKKGIENPVCVVANYLHPDAKVVAGNTEALDFLEANAKQFSIDVMKRLNVSGAFHTPLMRIAEEALYPVVRDAQIKKPNITVYSNMSGLRYGPNLKNNQRMLLKQMSHPVKWEQSLHSLYERKQDETFPHTFEVGPGRQLGALLRKVNAKAFGSYTAIEV